MSFKRFFLHGVIFLSIVLMAGCKTTKPGRTVKLRPKSAKFLMNRLVKNQISAEWLSGKARVTYRDDYNTKKITVNIRMRKDSLIWMNFKKVSVEAVRIQITPDSIYIINRLDNEYAIEPFEYIRRDYGITAGFGGLQAIILGNPVFFTKKLNSDIDRDRYRISGKTDHYDTHYWLEAAELLLSEMAIEDFRNKRNMAVVLSDYRELPDGQNFSYFRHLNLSSREYGDMSIKIDLSKVEINVPKSIRFEIPSRYKRVVP